MFNFSVHAQTLLASNVTLNADQQKLGALLNILEQKGSFRFSYNSNILPVDSLVSIHETNMNIVDVLDKLLSNRYEYRQSGNFIIIRYAPLELLLRINESTGNAGVYTITGQIVDKRTERPIQSASIYEKNLLVSELSDGNGYFTMRLKNVTQPVSLTVNKENYKSIVTHFLAGVDISATKAPVNDRFVDGDLEGIERTWLGKALVTTKQKIQSVNIGGFIAKAPFQFALLPGLNSHGSLSGQVVNKFSFNAIGAYSAGVDGGEIGLIFNINKSDVQYFQFAGAFNMVGGDVRGVQIAGFFNYGIGNVAAAQVALAYNRVGRDFEGFQVGGIYNQVNRNLRGVQISLGLNVVAGNMRGVQVGAFNLTPKSADGIQIGIAGNITAGKSRGVQVAGIANINKTSDAVNIAALANLTSENSTGLQIGTINYARKLNGVQVGLINVSQKNEGYAIGLLNLAWHGYHKLSFTTNESTELNLAYKGGSNKLYNILSVGTNRKSAPKIYTGGLGFGTELKLLNSIYLNPEISSQYVYQGSWDYLNLLNKFELGLNLKLTKWFAIHGGPSVNIYYTDQNTKVGDFGLLQQKHRDFTLKNPRYTGWIGWSVGVAIL